MPQKSNPKSTSNSSTTDFVRTRWTLVLQAGGAHGPSEAVTAMGELYKRYYRPLIGFLRSKGQPESKCEDLLHGFFSQLIAKSTLSRVQREKGKFRTFIRAALHNYMIDRWRVDSRMPTLSIDQADENTGASLDLQSVDPGPDRDFDRLWAMNLLRNAMDKLKEEHDSRGRLDLFKKLQVYLAEKKPGQSYAQAAEELGMTETAVKTTVSRMRQRFREIIEEEIADTLAFPTRENIEEEKRALLAALGSSS